MERHVLPIITLLICKDVGHEMRTTQHSRYAKDTALAIGKTMNCGCFQWLLRWNIKMGKLNITQSVMPIWHTTFETCITLMMLAYIKLTLRSRKVGNTSKPNLKVCAVVSKIIQSLDNNCMSGIVIIRNVCVLAWFEASLPVLWLWPFLSQYNLQSNNIILYI